MKTFFRAYDLRHQPPWTARLLRRFGLKGFITAFGVVEFIPSKRNPAITRQDESGGYPLQIIIGGGD